MKVLIITGDRKFGPGHPRYELQKSVVEVLEVVYVGRHRWLPGVPHEKFDVVTTQDPFWRGLFAWRVARRSKAKLNVQIHADLFAQSFLKRLIARIVLPHADSVRVVSEKLKNQITALDIRVPITILPVFVDLSTFSSIMRQPHASKNILWMGRFEKEKNPLEAIEVLREVLQTIPDARLTMLGEGAMSKEVSSTSANLPVSKPGWQNPAVFLDVADVVLCTSWHESWGASIVESLAAGVAVVAPDVGIAREAGALVVSHEELAGKVIEVLQQGLPGVLHLALPTGEQWAKLWRESLLPGRVEAYPQ